MKILTLAISNFSLNILQLLKIRFHQFHKNYKDKYSTFEVKSMII